MASERESIIQVDNVKPIKTPGQKRQRNVAIIVILAILVGGAVGYYFMVPREKSYVLSDYTTAKVERGSLPLIIQSSGTVSLAVQVSLSNTQEGYAETLLVDEGDYVNKGDVLAELSVPDLEETLQDSQTDLIDAKQSFEKLKVENRFTIENKEWDIEQLKNDIKDAEEDVEKAKALVEINASRQSELDSAEEALENLQLQLEEQERSLAQTLVLNELNESAQEANINQMEINIGRIEEDIEDSRIKSTLSGEVLSIASDLKIPGIKIKSGTELFTIADRSSAVIELEIYEEYSSYLKEGMEVALTISNETLTGTIDSISKIAQQSSDGLGSTITIEVIPESTDSYLTPGATAVGEMTLGSKEDVLLLPRGSYLTTGNQKYVYVIRGDKAEKVKVTYGEIQGTQVEITDGLEDGDVIISSGYQNFIEYQTINLKEGE